ncbi:MAG: hypothetical protein HON70_04445, partial [Lentisphaerae bacterium]|nr:hypothetical protein [Lentisphaerota bacterium]
MPKKHASQTNPRNRIVSLGLAIVVILSVVWQAVEHRRVRTAERKSLASHAQDIATSLEVVLRSQSRFGTVHRNRLEAALKALSKSSDLISLALVSPSGETVASAGASLRAAVGELPAGTQQWTPDELTVVELVRFAPTPGDTQKKEKEDGPEETEERKLLLVEGMPGPGGPRRGGRRDVDLGDYRRPAQERTWNDPDPEDEDGRRAKAAPRAPTDSPSVDTVQEGKTRRSGFFDNIDPAARDRFRKWLRDHGRRGERPSYPPWLSEEQFTKLFEKHGLQRFVLVLSALDTNRKIRQDLWLRAALGLLVMLIAGALSLNWGSLSRATELRLRLVRTQEMNTHLREMNTAAAGLAHETRNPLNAVRGIAQLIAGDEEVGCAGRERAKSVIAEVDRVNSRLGEFIAYSRPRHPNLAPVDVPELVDDVLRALDMDREDKQIEVTTDLPTKRVM